MGTIDNASRKEVFPVHPGWKRALALILIFFAVWLFAKWLLPLCFPFLLGLALALAAEPMTALLHNKLRVPRGASGCIGVAMAFCLLAMALLLLCAFAVRELGALARILPDLEQAARSGAAMAQSFLMDLTQHMPERLRPLVQDNIQALFSDGAALVDRSVRYLLAVAGSLLSHIPDSALGLGTTILSGMMISAKLPRMRQWLRRRIPRQKLEALGTFWQRLRQALGGWLTAQSKLMAITFVILVLGFILLRIPYAPVWALGICLIDVFPVLGTGTILLPWSLLSLLQGNGVRALGLLGVYITASVTRSALEPKLLGRHLGLDPLVTLVILYAGYKLWGIGGMLLAPLLAVIAMQLLPQKESGGPN